MSDTFNFFKIYGKNYLKNYFTINGLLLIMMMVLVIGGFREFFSQIFGGNTEGQQYYFEQYLQENLGILVVLCIIITLLFIAISIVNYAYPVFYLKRLSEGGDSRIHLDEILHDFKNNIGKLATLFLGFSFIFLPIIFFALIVSIALVFLIIGIPLLFIIIPVMGNMSNFLIYDYLHTSRGFFGSLKYTFVSQFTYQDRQKSPFWKYWASFVALYMIIQIVVSVLTFIPIIIWIAASLSHLEAGNHMEEQIGIFMFITYSVSILLSFVMSNLISINAGLMYYDSRIDLHRKMDIAEIDQIGKNEI